MSRVAFIGAGMMASAMVEGMRRRGAEVTVWNRTFAKAQALERLGARAEADPERAVAGAGVVHVMLKDDATVDALLEQIGPHLAPGALVVDHTTVSPAGTLARFARMEQRGVPFLHAPVFMSPFAARDAKGVMLAAGPRETFERAKPELEKMTADLWYVGEQRDRAAAFKLCGNLFIFTMISGLTDMFSLARGLGIEPPEAHRLFEHFRPDATIDVRGGRMARCDFAAAFELTMARKDAQLMLDAAASGGAKLSLLPVVVGQMERMIAAGRGSDDASVIAAEAVCPPASVR
jgi:3-hydroxyisobutyrate dehydrogenase